MGKQTSGMKAIQQERLKRRGFENRGEGDEAPKEKRGSCRCECAYMLE
tara:strand:- start:111 stop:254 length:144 start_codon:yes stop_codon:yes gene_type:complete